MNMKKILLSILSALVLIPVANAWNGREHFAIARIAEMHLTPQAKAALNDYLNGTSIVEIAMDADFYAGIWIRDLGFVPNNPNTARPKNTAGFDFNLPEQIAPWCHRQKLDKNDALYMTNSDGSRFVPSAAYDVDTIVKKLKKEVKKMTPEERYKYIALVVHLIGDLHQPMKFAYESINDASYGHVKVFFGQKAAKKKSGTYLDTYWQDPLKDYGVEELAKAADTATEKEIDTITKGNIYTWTLKNAMLSKPLHVAKETVLPERGVYYVEHREFALSQIRNAGYRLASVLNDLFAKYK